jgi:hypothetical protein
MGGAPLTGSCATPCSIVCPRPYPNLPGEQGTPLSIHAWWDSLFPVDQGMHPGDKGGEKAPSPQSQTSPQNHTRNLEQRQRTLRQFSWKSHFIVLAQTQQIQVQRLSLKNKGSLPYIPLKEVYRSKKQIWFHEILLATSTAPPLLLDILHIYIF